MAQPDQEMTLAGQPIQRAVDGLNRLIGKIVGFANDLTIPDDELVGELVQVIEAEEDADEIGSELQSMGLQE